jgi:hypothetical protein
MKGASLEVSFLLEPIRNALGAPVAGKSYDVQTYTGYNDDSMKNHFDGDWTRLKPLVF